MTIGPADNTSNTSFPRIGTELRLENIFHCSPLLTWAFDLPISDTLPINEGGRGEGRRTSLLSIIRKQLEIASAYNSISRSTHSLILGTLPYYQTKLPPASPRRPSTLSLSLHGQFIIATKYTLSLFQTRDSWGTTRNLRKGRGGSQLSKRRVQTQRLRSPSKRDLADNEVN